MRAHRDIEYMQGIYPILLVADVARSAEFCRSKLGFEFAIPAQAADHLQGDFAMLVRGGVTIQLKAVPGGLPRPNASVHEWARQDAFIASDDPESLCLELRAKGVHIVSAVADTEWGTREFRFADDTGYTFACGHAQE